MLHKMFELLERGLLKETSATPFKALNVPGSGYLLGWGSAVPADAATGWSIGALFLQTDGGAGTCLYVNEGTANSADFNPVSEAAGLSALAATVTEINRVCDRSTRQVAAGGTLTLTEAAHDGKTILLDTAAGSVVTLPAPVLGMRVRFLVSVKPTSNFHQVKVASAADFMAGSVNILDNDAAAQGGYSADGAADDNIQMNGTTKGGLVGDWLEIEGVSATKWAIRGSLVVPAGSNPADPFSAAV